jgi:ribosomal protein L35
MRSHNFEHKASKKKRKFDKQVEVAHSDYKALKQMLRVK